MMLFPQEMKLHLHLGGLGMHLLCAALRNVALAAPPLTAVLSSCDSVTPNGYDCWGRGAGKSQEKHPLPLRKAPEEPQEWNYKVSAAGRDAELG